MKLLTWLKNLFSKKTAEPVSKPIEKPATPKSASETPWLDWMISHIGEPEKTGAIPTEFNKMIFSHTNYGPLKRMDAGCAATICAALELTGYKSTKSAAAKSYLTYGTPCEAIEGAIGVFRWANGSYHVTILRKKAGLLSVPCVGGNQSSLLKESTYLTMFLVATRWPVK